MAFLEPKPKMLKPKPVAPIRDPRSFFTANNAGFKPSAAAGTATGLAFPANNSRTKFANHPATPTTARPSIVTRRRRAQRRAQRRSQTRRRR